MSGNNFLNYMTQAKGIFTSYFNIPATSIKIESEDNNSIIFIVEGIDSENKLKKARVRVKKGD
ncbi:MAG: hypothetical protein RR478_04130 [Bacilli bacterium]